MVMLEHNVNEVQLFPAPGRVNALIDMIESYFNYVSCDAEDYLNSVNGNPFDNTGGWYGNDEIIVRAYPWDYEFRGDDCDWTIEYKDYRISWYKHTGRCHECSDPSKFTKEVCEEIYQACQRLFDEYFML